MLILKSASPRRKEIFEKLGLRFQISPSFVDETQLESEPYLAYLRRVSLAKLEISKIVDPSFTYVASDTIVVFQNKIFPKPNSFEECFEFLQALNGKVHSVFSSVAIYKNSSLAYDYDETLVKMKNWTQEEIWDYIQKQKPLDKAGGYGIQDINSPVENFEGSFTNVLGFPLRKFFYFIQLWKDYSL